MLSAPSLLDAVLSGSAAARGSGSGSYASMGKSKRGSDSEGGVRKKKKNAGSFSLWVGDEVCDSWIFSSLFGFVGFRLVHGAGDSSLIRVCFRRIKVRTLTYVEEFIQMHRWVTFLRVYVGALSDLNLRCNRLVIPVVFFNLYATQLR